MHQEDIRTAQSAYSDGCLYPLEIVVEAFVDDEKVETTLASLKQGFQAARSDASVVAVPNERLRHIPSDDASAARNYD